MKAAQPTSPRQLLETLEAAGVKVHLFERGFTVSYRGRISRELREVLRVHGAALTTYLKLLVWAKRCLEGQREVSFATHFDRAGDPAILVNVGDAFELVELRRKADALGLWWRVTVPDGTVLDEGGLA